MTDFTIDPELYAIPLASGGHETRDQGVCGCGCGQRAPIAKRACPRQGVRRGDQLRYVSGHNSRRPPDLSRFVITEAGCHEWTGPRNRKGYARIQAGSVHRQAHAVVWEQEHGPVPDGLHVDHKCQNPPCIRLDHLRLLTPLQNNRAKRGSKLNVAQAAEIRASELPVTILARQYGISHQYASDVRAGRRMATDLAELRRGVS
jgi:hypothetical protein